MYVGEDEVRDLIGNLGSSSAVSRPIPIPTLTDDAAFQRS